MNEYLKETKLCNFHNKKLLKKLGIIIQDAKNKREKALKIFFFIRDTIDFNSTLNIYIKASKTLKSDIVDYCNKINLHTALLRAEAIPVRLHYVEIEKEILEFILPKFIYKHLPNPIGHFYCECFINEKWIACEALYDKELYEGMINTGIITREQIPTIDWDGEHDLILLNHWIVREKTFYQSFDELIEKEVKEAGMPPKIFCKLFDWIARLGSRHVTRKIRNSASTLV